MEPPQISDGGDIVDRTVGLWLPLLGGSLIVVVSSHFSFTHHLLSEPTNSEYISQPLLFRIISRTLYYPYVFPHVGAISALHTRTSP
jgi:hypothetical protein